jgi:hypothetical protein
MIDEKFVYDVVMTDATDNMSIPYALFLTREAAEKFIDSEKDQYGSCISFDIDSRILYEE